MPMQRPRQSGRQSGFGIIEVLVAAMLIMISLVSLCQLFALAIVYNQNSRQQTVATSLANRWLEWLQSLPLSDAQLAYGGTLDATSPDPACSLKYFVEPTTQRISTSAFTTGQEASYLLMWRVNPSGAAPVRVGLREITVRVEALGAINTLAGAAREIAEVSSYRMPTQPAIAPPATPTPPPSPTPTPLPTATPVPSATPTPTPTPTPPPTPIPTPPGRIG